VVLVKATLKLLQLLEPTNTITQAVRQGTQAQRLSPEHPQVVEAVMEHGDQRHTVL